MKLGEHTEDFSSGEELDVYESDGDEDLNEMDDYDVPIPADEVDPEDIEEVEDFENNDPFEDVEEEPVDVDVEVEVEIEDPEDMEEFEDIEEPEDAEEFEDSEEPEVVEELENEPEEVESADSPDVPLPSNTTEPTGPEFDPKKLKITKVIEPVPFSSENEEEDETDLANPKSVEAEVSFDPEDTAED